MTRSSRCAAHMALAAGEVGPIITAHGQRSRSLQAATRLAHRRGATMTVRIDLLRDHNGPYRLTISARPDGLAAPSDIDATSGDLVVGAGDASRSLVFPPCVPIPTGTDAVPAPPPPITLLGLSLPHH